MHPAFTPWVGSAMSEYNSVWSNSSVDNLVCQEASFKTENVIMIYLISKYIENSSFNTILFIYF